MGLGAFGIAVPSHERCGVLEIFKGGKLGLEDNLVVRPIAFSSSSMDFAQKDSGAGSSYHRHCRDERLGIHRAADGSHEQLVDPPGHFKWRCLSAAFGMLTL